MRQVPRLAVVDSWMTPVVIPAGSHDWGSCLSSWSLDFLINNCDDIRASIHASNTPFLDYANKNFDYEVVHFKDFLNKLKSPVDSRYYYYRALHTKIKKAANLEVFGDVIASGFRVPVDLVPSNSTPHSTVMRIGSPELAVWLHYDMCDNYLLQIKGTKRVVLYPPAEVPHMDIDGSSSTFSTEALFSGIDPHGAQSRWECVLDEGDALFIPALWFHATMGTDPNSVASIAVNHFFILDHVKPLHASKDIWANKDLVAYADALESFKKVLDLPEPYREFYRLRLLSALRG